MNELEVFKNEDFGEVRTVLVDGKPYFVATDKQKHYVTKTQARRLKTIVGM